MNEVAKLLETKRKKLGKTQKAFAKTLKMQEADYSRVKGGKPIPRSCRAAVAELLRISVKKLNTLSPLGSGKWKISREKKWSAEELILCAKIVKKAGRPLTLANIKQILKKT